MKTNTWFKKGALLSLFSLVIAVFYCLLSRTEAVMPTWHHLTSMDNSKGEEISYLEKDFMALTQKVSPFIPPLYTGTIYPLSDQAQPILIGSDVFGVASRYGKGRVVVLGHDQFADDAYLQSTPAAQQFMNNVHKWLTQNKKKPLLVANPYMTFEEAQTIKKRVENGAGLLISYAGWVLDYTPSDEVSRIEPPVKRLEDYPLQQMLNQMGIAMTALCDLKENETQLLSYEQSKHYHFSRLWRNLNEPFSEDETTVVNATAPSQYKDHEKALEMFRGLDKKTSFFKTITNNASKDYWIENPSPITGQNIVLRNVLLKNEMGLAPNQQAHPQSTYFPGNVDNQAKRITTSVQISPLFNDASTSVSASPWLSTGLYAPAGETLTVVVPQRIDIQIGAHTDTLEWVETLKRMPDITSTQSLSAGTHLISSAYGGLIYFKAPSEGDSFEVKIVGAVESPYFVLGSTSDKSWVEQLKSTGAPWAELNSGRVILTIPTEIAKQVLNPTLLMNTWNTIIATEEELAGLSPSEVFPHQSPKVPWRVVVDAQLSYGFMYAGYPIMAHSADSALNFINPETLKHSEWGIWHEFGHNYQIDAMTWTDVIEVTNNLYALYVEEKFDNPSRLNAPNDITGLTPYESVKMYMERPIEEREFGELDYFERLVMFDELRRIYGWSFYRELHKAYRELKPESIPQNDFEKIQLFIDLTSTIANKDLSPFFRQWGLLR